MGYINNIFKIVESSNIEEDITIKAKIVEIKDGTYVNHNYFILTLNVGCRVICSKEFFVKNNIHVGDTITIFTKEISYNEDMPYIQ